MEDTCDRPTPCSRYGVGDLIWQGTGNVAGSGLSNATWGTIALTELIVHGWDLAVATDQSFDLPDPPFRPASTSWPTSSPTPPSPGLWGPPVDVAPDAPLLDRIVAISGRTRRAAAS